MKKSNSPLLDQWGNGEPAALELARHARLIKGLPVEDFITARPHDHGFRFSEKLLQQAQATGFTAAAKGGYGAEAAGWMPAREAVAAWHGGSAVPTDVLLTPGTSLAYYYLFRLLAHPHAEVLCPAPTYPLFDDIARLAGVRVKYYHLHKTTAPGGATRWELDGDELRFQLSSHTAAIVVVSPHNPTGTVISPAEINTVTEVARQAGVPVIFDEVFRFYTRSGVSPPRITPPEDVTWITLDGLSKSHYLPGLKAGWIVVEGKGDLAERLRHGLEYIADTFLPVSDGVQKALPLLLGNEVKREILRLSTLMWERMDARLRSTLGCGLPVSRPEAGPYLCIPLLYDTDANDFAVKLLEEQGALFHPGQLYGMAEPCLIATGFNPAEWPVIPRG